MKVTIGTWEPEYKVVQIDTGLWHAPTVIKIAELAAGIELPNNMRLDREAAGDMAEALTLAAKVAGYLDDLESDEALAAIAGLPTTPYDGWRPMPRAGRTENP